MRRLTYGALWLSRFFRVFLANTSFEHGCSRLTALSHHDRFLAVAFATTQYASLARNWALSLTRLVVHNKVVLGVDFDSLKDAEVVPVRTLCPHAWQEWKMSSHSTHLTALWLLRSATLEYILGGDCLPSHTLVLHSDVDVVFLRDPRPHLTQCHSCFGAGEFPHNLATKWQSATACAGFFARRSGDALRLNQRITRLTREFGDDQLATNQAIDELGLVRRISLLDPALFPVGGCDTWLGVLASLRKQVSPVVLHPNCVDKTGISKEGWLRQRGAWLLSDVDTENTTNTTAASVLAAASCRYKSDALRVTLQNTVLLLFEGERALLEIGDLLNQRRLVGAFILHNEAGIIAKRRQQQGHAVFVLTTPRLLFPAHCLEVPDNENGMAIVSAGLNCSTAPCFSFNAPQRDSRWLHRHLDALSHYTTTNGLSSHVHITNIRSCEAGRIVSADVVRSSALAPTEIWTRLHSAAPQTFAIVDDGDGHSRAVHAQHADNDTVYTRISLSRRRHRVTVKWFVALQSTKVNKSDETLTNAVSLHTATVEYFESWLASLSALFVADAPLSCLASPHTFSPCQRVVAAHADLAIQFANLSDTVDRLRMGGSVLFSIATTLTQARQMAETAGLTIVDAHTGPLQLTLANADTYTVVVVWAIKTAYFPATQRSVIEKNDDSDLTAAYEQATRLEDHGARVDALFAAGARLHEAHRQRAATYYQRVLQIQPSFGPALGNLAALYYSENRVTEAIELLERAVAAGQNTSIEDLFRAQARLSRAKKAGLLERALALIADDSRDATVRVVLNRVDVAALCVFSEWRDYVDAVVHGTPRLLYAPRFDDPEFFLATELTRRGYRVLTASCDALWATLEAGDTAYHRDKAAAARAYSYVIERCGGQLPMSDPASLLVELLAGVHQNSGRQAVKALAFYKLGVLAHERLELRDAESLYLSALECNSELADAWNNLGVIHIRTDRLETGAACLHKGSAAENRRVATDLMLAQDVWLRTPRLAHAKVHILAGFYRGVSSVARFKNELQHAQRLNLGLESVVALHSFSEDVDPRRELNSEKLVAINWRRQPDYADFLEYANHHLAGKVVVIAHTDIYFDETIGCASSLLVEAHAQRMAFAITRRPAPACPLASGGGHLHGLPTNLCAADSTIHGYDAFAFVAPVPEVVVAATRGLKQNALGSDLRFIDALRTVGGYTLYNPCAQIAAYHLHCTRERSYDFNTTNRDLGQPVPVTKLSASRRFNSLCAAHSPEPVALSAVLVASYPRSGSTMLRTLVEQATATKTGSTHFDAGMLVEFGFLGEGYCASSSVAVVKTHHPAVIDFGPSDCQDLLRQAQANQAPMALLIRDPFEAIRSYWEYHDNSKGQPSWPDFAVAEARRWRLVVEYWRGAVDLTVRYEDLLTDPLGSLRALLSLIELNTSSVDQPQRRRFHARTTYSDKLLAAVFVAAGGHDVLCTFGYDPPPLFSPCPSTTETTPLLASPTMS